MLKIKFRINHISSALIAVLCLAGSGLVLGEVNTENMPHSATELETTSQQVKDADIEKSRGQLLYENHCGGCHETSVHGRSPRKADSIASIRQWIGKWQTELKLNWTDADINEVARYLNFKYYQFTE